MPNTQKKFLKKKEREKKVKVKLARRRVAIQTQAKERAQEEAAHEAAFVLKNGKREPILNDPEAIAAREERKKAQVQERLERNLKILEALESEFDAEQKGREQVQKNLEAEGHKTIKDKLQALHARAKQLSSMTDAIKEYAEEVREDLKKDDQPKLVQGSALCKPAKGLSQALFEAAKTSQNPPPLEGYTPERVLEAKEGEEIVREELSGDSNPLSH